MISNKVSITMISILLLKFIGNRMTGVENSYNSVLLGKLKSKLEYWRKGLNIFLTSRTNQTMTLSR